MAVAEASLRISILAISCGLIPRSPFDSSSISPLMSEPVGASDMMIPSTTYSGSLDPLREVTPLILIDTPAPGAALFDTTSTPAAAPVSIWSSDVVLAA